MKKVLVFGTFDIFHEGHKNFLRQAKMHGDWLRVVIARDKTVLKVKNLWPLNNELERKANIEKSALADEVVLGNVRDVYKVVKDYKPDVICLGYDQVAFIDELESKLKEFGLKNTLIIQLKPYKPDLFKSSKLKK
ncbi:MAG: FAD synthase [Parcubacteria group bacterium GW2011_GWE2_39_37]|nr:MAG: FAD synthase [Parcubacteria group bacterium GW2011_GWE2_39_37]